MQTKSPFKLAVKSWGKMLVSIVLCLFVLMFFGGTSITAVEILLQIIQLAIFGGIMYQYYWNAGSNEKNASEMNNTNPDKFKGLKSGLISVIPFAVMYAVLIIMKLFFFDKTIFSAVVISILSLLNSPFRGFIDVRICGMVSADIAKIGIGNIIASACTMLFVPTIAAVGYIMGIKRISISNLIIYKNPSKKS